MQDCDWTKTHPKPESDEEKERKRRETLNDT